ncbi:uncharacterized protein LOC110271584 [Arachis ipaensis]|nr:uncharacterized protein LOC110271584 [Arachis ipaensis]
MTFFQKKAAKQDAARIALESLKEKIKDDRCPLVVEDILISKSIMNECATKLNVEGPTYNTVLLEGLLPRFMFFVIFNGTKYASVIRKNKQEAEPLAARAAILSDHKDKEVPMATNNGEKRIDVVFASSNTLSSSQELQIPTHVPCAEGPFPPKNFSLQPGGSELGQLATGDTSSSSSKRQKNKKKSNNRARLESM